MDPLHFYCGSEALDRCISFCRERSLQRFRLVCDRNTYAVLGEKAEIALKSQGFQVHTIVLDGKEVIADEEYLIQVLMQADDQPCTYLAVGSGTLTDISRFCSHRSRNPFISLPTAPSVDGFASVIAPVVIRRFKDTAYAQAPIAIFADLPTLCSAPPRMLAAGFGDMLGKYTALADWKLAQLLWDEPYRPDLAERTRKALQACVDQAEGIRRADPESVESLIFGLVESGLCMLENGNSRPASGSEHHLSHFWEMKLLLQGRPAVLHGIKVGIGTVQIARRYEAIRQLTPQTVQDRLSKAVLPNSEQHSRQIQHVFGPIASQVLKEQSKYLERLSDRFNRLKVMVAEQWSEILEIAASVPDSRRIIQLLEVSGAPTELSQIGMSTGDLEEALQNAHYLRSQFTVTRLGNLLGFW